MIISEENIKQVQESSRSRNMYFSYLYNRLVLIEYQVSVREKRMTEGRSVNSWG